jgi:hypothetical protein
MTLCFAWHPVRLQSGNLVWLRYVEYEEFKFTIAPWMLGGVVTARHYRPAVLKGPCGTEAKLLNN